MSCQNHEGRSSREGSVLRADVDGQILMRAYLSGTPECKFGLNDKLVLQKRCAESCFVVDHGLILVGRKMDHAPRMRSSWTTVNSINVSA